MSSELFRGKISPKAGWTLFLSITILVGYCHRDAWCQSSGSSPAARARNHLDDPTVALLYKEIDQIEQSKEIDDATKSSILALYREAVQDIVLAETWEAAARKSAQEAGSADDEITQAKAKLADTSAMSLPEVPPDLTLQELEKQLGEAEKDLAAANEVLAEAKIKPHRRTIRRLEIESLLKVARTRAAALEKQQNALPAERPAGPMEIARRHRLSSALKAVQQEIQAYSKELAAYTATIELLPLSLDLAAREASICKKTVKTLKKRVADARQRDAEAQIHEAAQKAAMADPTLHDLAVKNQELAEERREVIGKIRQDQEIFSDTRSLLDLKTREFENATEQLKREGQTDYITPAIRQSLRNIQPDIEAIRARRRIIRDTQKRLIILADRRAELTIQEEQLAPPPDDGTDIQALEEQDERDQAQRGFIKTQKQYVDLLSKEYTRYYELLIDLNSAQIALLDVTEEYLDFIDEQVLWISSASPIWDVSAWPAASDFLIFTKTNLLVASVEHFLSDYRQQPLTWIAALLLLCLLIYKRLNAKTALQEIGERASAAGMQRFWPTVQAMLLTALLAAPLLGGLAFLAWRVSAATGMPEPTRAFAVGLLKTSLIIFPVEFFRQSCRAKGLAESHFGWPAAATSRLHTWLLRLILPTFPLLAVAVAMNALHSDIMQDLLGRVCFIAAFFMVALITYILVRKNGEVFRSFAAMHPEVKIPRVFFVLFLFMTVLPLLLCVIAALGYYFTAWHLALRWLATVLFCLSLLILGEFLFRWILIVRRRMAIESARRQREEALKAAAENSGEEMLPEFAPTPAVNTGPDLDVINRQVRRLVFVVLGVAAVGGLWIIWDDVLPALGIFKGVELWSTEVQASQGGVAISRAITLADLTWALLILGLTFVAARNIPGLLEISILRNLPIDKGLRFAITTVCRYVLIGIGIVWACNYLGLSWGKVQWILAAMSVGLGFGLQEIFANFASGMIILFERPIRIGDIITIGDATGKVLRIQMRATTILDWDKKELVVPNKEFATGRLLNWTLTDTVNRLVVDVGVSYKSDPEQVRDLLLKIAADHPKVVDSPKPICIFKDFGANALQFSLRIYLASMKGRLDVIHQMHTNIYKAFAEAGIEIAYPQLDLHIRSGLNDRQNTSSV